MPAVISVLRFQGEGMFKEMRTKERYKKGGQGLFTVGALVMLEIVHQEANYSRIRSMISSKTRSPTILAEMLLDACRLIGGRRIILGTDIVAGSAGIPKRLVRSLGELR